MARFRYYVVSVGRRPDIYNLWAECHAQINGFKSALYVGAQSLQEAHQMLGGIQPEGMEREVERTVPDVQRTQTTEVLSETLQPLIGHSNSPTVYSSTAMAKTRSQPYGNDESAQQPVLLSSNPNTCIIHFPLLYVIIGLLILFIILVLFVILILLVMYFHLV
ncbi:hypothetical protein QJS10_CPB22g00665 [Acorus calamus]|uniref:Ribonuclease H1 N-terminal domain-containing protein n=1 Tax=Acorus calamus TaxID=4465 RepID=A0AAV9C2I5_ACOCL|nr:hypothetical protein QJS10_CPB22g00665 [Acorus calamus]